MFDHSSQWAGIRLFRFGLVGLSGVVVNAGFLYLFHNVAGLPVALSSAFAIEISVLSNFALNDSWTWKDKHGNPLWRRCIDYHLAVGFSALVVNWGLLVFLVSHYNMNAQLANLIGITCGMVLNFLLNHFWTYK